MIKLERMVRNLFLVWKKGEQPFKISKTDETIVKFEKMAEECVKIDENWGKNGGKLEKRLNQQSNLRKLWKRIYLKKFQKESWELKKWRKKILEKGVKKVKIDKPAGKIVKF